MSGQPKKHIYKSLPRLVRKLRDDLGGASILLLNAYNRTGKTRLSMEFKDYGKRKNNGSPDTLYFNAFTEDLFNWENDLEGDARRHLRINTDSTFFNGLKDLALDSAIEAYLSNYTDFQFKIDYVEWTVSFSKDGAENIKISRGEENLFIWCLFMALCESVIDGLESYQWVKYIYIDDPISSLDDNNAISVACDLTKLLRRIPSRKNSAGVSTPIKAILSTHHSLFFNVMCNELGRAKTGESKAKHKRYFLHRPNSGKAYTLCATGDTPSFHHVATLIELQRAASKGKLFTFHFNALRSIMEKTASFFGHSDISSCLKAMDNEENEALFNRALNLLSHGQYAIHEPTLMGEDNQNLFRQILADFITHFQFDLPEILNPTPLIPGETTAAQENLTSPS